VNRPRHNFFTCSRFSADQNRATPLANQLNRAVDLIHGGAIAHQKLSPPGHRFRSPVHGRAESDQFPPVSLFSRAFNLLRYSIRIEIRAEDMSGAGVRQANRAQEAARGIADQDARRWVEPFYLYQ
jgi:hypothetical protein